MTVALDRQPQIRQQLELGNVGEAVKHLNVIINSQAQHIQAQDGQLQHCNSEIERLNGRNSALEAEAEGWENKYRNLEESVNRRIEEVEAKYESRIKEMERSYARSLLMLKEKGNNS